MRSCGKAGVKAEATAETAEVKAIASGSRNLRLISLRNCQSINCP